LSLTERTREVVQIAAVLVVGGSRALTESVRRAIRGLQGAVIVPCAVREASTRAAEVRPFAIVMNDDLYAFDSAEFDALARDVQAELITGAWDDLHVVDGLTKPITRAFELRRRRMR
jgi:hypothetical protein